jgi:hypothetical protein
MYQTFLRLVDYGTFACQRSWLGASATDSSVLLVCYEDLIGDDGFLTWQRVLEHFDIAMPPPVLAELLHEHSFESRTQRKPGEENRQSHFRKGVHGDWVNHFDDRLRAGFKERAARLLVDLGYEMSDAW